MPGTRSLLRLASVAATAILAGALLVAVNDANGSVPATPLPSGSGTPNTSPSPPTPPTNLRATAVTSTSVTLSWTASSRGCCAITGYDITSMPAFNDYGRVIAVGDVTTATVTTDIRPGQQYTFQVSAHDDLGHRSGGSNQVVVVTPVTDTGDTVPPAAPTGLRADPTNGPSTTLTWSPATDNVAVTGYDVYRFDGLFISTLLATVPGTTTYTAAVVSPRDQFYVRARDAAGNVSIASNTVVVTGGTGGPGSPSASVSPSAPPVLSCRATFTYTSVWASGFVADVTVTNTGATPINDWVITFTFGGDQRVGQAWNATAGQTGAAVTLTHASWNRVVPPGGSVTVGMYGARTAPLTPPPVVAVNGVPCSA